MMQYIKKTENISNQIKKILNSFDDYQIKKVSFDFEGDERYKWYYTPHEQNGLLLFEMKPYQRKLLFELLELTYSSDGYKTARSIINLESILGEYESNHADSKEGGSGQWVRSEERYWLAIFGNPSSDKEPWGYRFGGHHIGLNVNIISDFISMHPLFFGANPAKVIEGSRKGFRALKPEEDLARKLVTSFSEDNRKIAIINEIAPPDILTANYRNFNNQEFVKGLNFSKFTNNQRDDLIDLIKVYVSRFTEDYAKNYLKQIITQGFDNTIFAWAGSTDISEGHYYFIKHDKFLIEYDNTQNNANHIHSVLRDFDGDYGEDILSNHYKSSH
ncbi:MAG: DUF3500 domain-containing protein [Chloroflexota bacterium]|nr:DUF3500 domain-containing protein [Chloroflexota bacterium]